MVASELHARLHTADRTVGGVTRTLVLAGWSLRLDGLDEELAERLERRWGGFLHRRAEPAPRYLLRVLRGGRARWLDDPAPGGLYRLEALREAGRLLIASQHFALAPEPQDRVWRVALSENAEEPAERILDNVARILAARLALESGGFALHAAGVERDGRAYLFAGKSRSGKSTAARLAAPARSLGDDFGLVLPGAGADDWLTAAMPFDNSACVTDPPVAGLLPVVGVWRLYQATAGRVERPRGAEAVASLMACAAFPWVLPDLAEVLLDHVRRFVASGRFAHLYFTREGPIGHQLGPA